MLTRTQLDAPVTELHVAAYTIPTDLPEADGTFAWDRTTLVTVEVRAGGRTGLGYGYADANGAYSRKQALAFAQRFGELGVSWFEEPVSSDDLEGLRLLRDRGPAGMDVAAGEYGYDLRYFRRMLDAGAVDVLQADATRCGGITGFLRVATLC